jgi:hypothetical protein
MLNDPSSVKILQNILEKCSGETKQKPELKTVNHLHTRRRTSREFRLNANIGDFNMGDIILDLGSEVNVLPKATWQCMGEPTLGYSTVQLKLANQHRVLPIGRLKGVTVDLDGVRTKADFEVIEIVDDTTPYPTLLGLDWAFDNQAIINLKTRKMTFESGDYRVIAPLDPSEGERFIEPTCLDLEEIDQLYRTTARDAGLYKPNCRRGTQLAKHYFMHNRLRHWVRKLAAKTTRSIHEKVCQNRPRSKVDWHRNQRTTQLSRAK